MRKSFLISRLGIGLGLMCAVLSGCAALQASITPTTSAQVTTLAEAEQAATLVSQAADTYVTSANPSQAQLGQIQTLSNAVHSALTDLETANAKGQSLTFAAFQAALTAFDAFEAAAVTPTASATAASGN